MIRTLALLIALAACTSPAASPPTSQDTDAPATDTADTDVPAPPSEMSFAGDVNGASFHVVCVAGRLGPNSLRAGADPISLLCPSDPLARAGQPYVSLRLEDLEAVFDRDGTDPVGTHLTFHAGDPNESLTNEAGNLERFELTGTWDEAGRHLLGTLDAHWTRHPQSGVIGPHGNLVLHFDVVVP